VIRAELKAAHLVGIHKEGWGSVERWCHEFCQIADLKLARILTEAEKEGQLNSGIVDWGIGEFWNWGILELGNSGIEEFWN
jgi:hypothetical protein